jgi:hypothetical protein
MERSGNFYKAIRLGYILISILIGCMAYNSLYEWQEIEALELGNKKIDELRKEINNINIQMIKFSLLGETILEWNDKDIEHYHARRMAMDSMLCRFKATMDNLDPNEESHVSSLDVDFSTGAPVAEFNAMCLGHSNVASSEVYLDQQLPAELIGTGICLGRGNGADGKIIPQSYLVYIRNYGGKAEMTFAHRGGYYVKPTECFGSGIIY